MDTNKLDEKIKLAHTELDLTQTQLAQKINSKQKGTVLFSYLEF